MKCGTELEAMCHVPPINHWENFWCCQKRANQQSGTNSRAYGRDLQPNFDKLDILDSKFTQLLFELQVNQAF